MKYKNWCDNLGWIPNTVGYSVQIKLKNGSTTTTAVIVDKSGCHCLEGYSVNDVLAWRSA